MGEVVQSGNIQCFHFNHFLSICLSCSDTHLRWTTSKIFSRMPGLRPRARSNFSKSSSTVISVPPLLRWLPSTMDRISASVGSAYCMGSASCFGCGKYAGGVSFGAELFSGENLEKKVSRIFSSLTSFRCAGDHAGRDLSLLTSKVVTPVWKSGLPPL